MMPHSVSAPPSHSLTAIIYCSFTNFFPISLSLCLPSLGPSGSGVCGAETRHQLSMVLKHPNQYAAGGSFGALLAVSVQTLVTFACWC